jgi:hypothetical protein
MLQMFLPALGAVFSAQNICQEIHYKKKLTQKPNNVIVCINAGLLLTNAAIFKSMLDKPT